MIGLAFLSMHSLIYSLNSYHVKGSYVPIATDSTRKSTNRDVAGF